MSDRLAQIIDGVRLDLDRRRAEMPLASLEAAIEGVPAAQDVVSALRAPGLSVIAEIKRASPSAGALADIPAPDEQALAYVGGGAAVISVLTEERYFHGSLQDFDLVRWRVDQPLLRKDFIISPYQVLESRLHRADMVLLIAAALSDKELRELYDLTTSLGMTALVEVHTEDEVKRALEIGPAVLGVNSRDLTTFEIDMSRFETLVTGVPEGIVVVAESGIHSPADARRMRQAGADGVLVGSWLVQDPNPGAAIRAMISAAGE